VILDRSLFGIKKMFDEQLEEALKPLKN